MNGGSNKSAGSEKIYRQVGARNHRVLVGSLVALVMLIGLITFHFFMGHAKIVEDTY